MPPYRDWEIYPDNKSLKYALCLMNIGKQKYKDAYYKINNRFNK